MNICFCLHRLPYPPIAGGRIETFNLLKGLAARGHDIRLVTYGTDDTTAREMEEAIGCEVTLVPGMPNRTPRNVARNLVSTDPLPVMKARTEGYTETVRNHAGDADVVHLHALQPSYLANDDHIACPTIVRLNNIKHEIYRQFARYTSNPAKAGYAYLQYLKTKRFETRVVEWADLTLTISAADEERLRNAGAKGNIRVLAPGVDLDRFSPGDGTDTEATITFFGSMDYHPNEDAVRWFGRDIFPAIREERPEATFEIVGKNPSPSVKSLADTPGISVTGFVDDITEYVNRAAVVVIPIRVGTGVRIKVLHAMALGKAIVTTSVGKRGIGFADGEHGVIADTEAEFITAVTELLDDPERRETLGRQARRLIEWEHDWETITAQLETIYRELCS